MSYDQSTVESAISVSEIGGGDLYTESEGKRHPSDADIEVETVSELKSALSGSKDSIAITSNLDLTGERYLDLGNKILIGDRGWDGSPGPILSTRTQGYVGGDPYTVFSSHNSPRVTGINLRGASYGRTRFYPNESNGGDYSKTLSRGIILRGNEAEIDNCEIGGFNLNGIHVMGYATRRRTDADIHHCHLHTSMQDGYGYGISHLRGFSHIHHNYFDLQRHSIDGFGFANSGYVAENNVFGPRQFIHQCDMHCIGENLRSGTNMDHDSDNFHLRAGERVDIRNNTFTTAQRYTDNGPLNAIAIRGEPKVGVWIENNRFAHSKRPTRNSGNSQRGDAWRQVNVTSSSYGGSLNLNSEGFTSRTWTDSGNQFNAPESPKIDGVGAPIDLLNPDLPDGVDRDRWLSRRRLMAETLRGTTAALSDLSTALRGDR